MRYKADVWEGHVLQQRPFCRISCCSVLLFYCLRAAAIDGVPCAACVFTSVDISALCCCSCNSTHKCCLMSSETWRVTDLSLRGIAIRVNISVEIRACECCRVGRKRDEREQSWYSRKAPRGLWGCKNRPAPFLGRMSYKATKPVYHILTCYIIVLWCIRTPFLCIVSFCYCVFCLLVVLTKLSVLAKWLARKTPSQKA